MRRNVPSSSVSGRADNPAKGQPSVFLVLADQRLFGSFSRAVEKIGEGAREALGIEPLLIGVSGPEHLHRLREVVVEGRRRGTSVLIVIEEGSKLLAEVVKAADLTLEAASLIRARPGSEGEVEFRLIASPRREGRGGPPQGPPPQGPFRCPSCGLVTPDELLRCPRCGAYSSAPPPSLGASVLSGPEEIAARHPSLGEVAVSPGLERRLRAAFFGRATAFRIHLLGALAEEEATVAELRSLSGAARRASPLPHQVEAARKALFDACGRALICDPPRAGRAVEVGLVLAELRTRKKATDVLLVAPKALLPCWQEELRAKFGLDFRTVPTGEEESVAARGKVALPLGALARLSERGLSKRRWDVVVVDEAHLLGDRRSPLWRAVFGLEADFLLLLTAFPFDSGPSGLLDLLVLLRPDVLGPPTEFGPAPALIADEEALGPEMPLNVREALLQVAVLTSAEPALVVQRRRKALLVAPPSPEAVGALWREAAEILSSVGQKALPPEETARRVASLHLEGRLLHLKAEALAGLLSEARGPAVIYVSDESIVPEVASRVANRGVQASVLADGPTVRPKPAQARTIVNLDLPPDPVTLSRRVERHLRQGAQGAVDVVFVCLKGSPEEKFFVEALDGAGFLDLTAWEAEEALREAFGGEGLEGLLRLLLRSRDEKGALERALLLAKERVRQEEARSIERLRALLGGDGRC